MKEYSFILPMPPSVNAAYRAVKGRVIKSKKYRDWSEEAARCMSHQDMGNIDILTGRIKAVYQFGWQDNRKRDIANFEKALSDFIEEWGVFENDCQIDHMELIRLNDDATNGVFVTITETKEEET